MPQSVKQADRCERRIAALRSAAAEAATALRALEDVSIELNSVEKPRFLGFLGLGLEGKV